VVAAVPRGGGVAPVVHHLNASGVARVGELPIARPPRTCAAADDRRLRGEVLADAPPRRCAVHHVRGEDVRALPASMREALTMGATAGAAAAAAAAAAAVGGTLRATGRAPPRPPTAPRARTRLADHNAPRRRPRGGRVGGCADAFPPRLGAAWRSRRVAGARGAMTPWRARGVRCVRPSPAPDRGTPTALHPRRCCPAGAPTLAARRAAVRVNVAPCVRGWRALRRPSAVPGGVAPPGAGRASQGLPTL